MSNEITNNISSNSEISSIDKLVISADVIDFEHITQRLKKALKIKTDKALAEHLGIKAPTLSMWIKRRAYDFALIFCKFPELSAEWIVSGNGPMLKKDIGAKNTGIWQQGDNSLFNASLGVALENEDAKILLLNTKITVLSNLLKEKEQMCEMLKADKENLSELLKSALNK